MISATYDAVDVAKHRRSGTCGRAAPAAGERIRFTSALLPKWARRTKILEALLPVLYLRGISAVPTVEEEDAKRQHREREHLVQERVRIRAIG